MHAQSEKTRMPARMLTASARLFHLIPSLWNGAAHSELGFPHQLVQSGRPLTDTLIGQSHVAHPS